MVQEQLNEFRRLMGELAASPTENTVLDRLKDIAGAIAAPGIPVGGPTSDRQVLGGIAATPSVELQSVQGNVADDAVSTGAPVLVGAEAADPAALPANVAVLDRAKLLTDLSRRLLVRDALVAAALAGGLPAALGAGGGLKVEGVAGGVAQPVSATQKWSTLGTFTAVLLGADVAPTLKSLASAARKITLAAIDNTVGRDQYAVFELLCRGAAAFTAGGTLDLYMIASADGINFEDGSDSVTPARAPDFRFEVRAVDTAQRIVSARLVLPPTKFHVLLVNSAGQALTNTNAENTLGVRTFNEAEV